MEDLYLLYPNKRIEDEKATHMFIVFIIDYAGWL